MLFASIPCAKSNVKKQLYPVDQKLVALLGCLCAYQSSSVDGDDLFSFKTGLLYSEDVPRTCLWALLTRAFLNPEGSTSLEFMPKGHQQPEAGACRRLTAALGSQVRYETVSSMLKVSFCHRPWLDQQAASFIRCFSALESPLSATGRTHLAGYLENSRVRQPAASPAYLLVFGAADSCLVGMPTIACLSQAPAACSAQV